MIRKRRQKQHHAHYCVLVHTGAANYDRKQVEKFVASVRRRGSYYTIYESDSADELVHRARLACGLKRSYRPLPDYLQRRGKVTSLVACGGDGTVNLAAGVALEGDLPVGILPLGRFNNVARSLYDSVEPEIAIEKILKRNYRRVDTAFAGKRLFIGSLGVGLIPQMAHLLEGKKLPRFGFRWAQLGAKAISTARMNKMTIKVDSFRFEVHPVMFNINLLPYSVGLPLSPASIFDDQHGEAIFDVGNNTKDLSSFVRLIYKKKYVYGSDVRLFRGKTITFQPVRGRTIYLDGELIKLPLNVIEVQIGQKQLKVFC